MAMKISLKRKKHLVKLASILCGYLFLIFVILCGCTAVFFHNQYNHLCEVGDRSNQFFKAKFDQPQRITYLF